MAHICYYLPQNASRLPDKTLTLCLDRAKSTKAVYFEVAALCKALRGTFGVTAGTRVGLIAKGTDHFLQAFLAVTACGAIAVPINLRWSVQEAAAALRHVSAGLLFIDGELVHKYASILDERCCIVLGSAAGRNQSAAIASSVQPDSRLHHAQDFIRDHMGVRLDLQMPEDGAALICFTSGTSGPPKGVVIGHTALHCQAMAKLHTVGYREDDVYLHCAPLFHIGGLSSMIAMLAVGATQVFQAVFNAAETLSLIKRHSVTSLIAVPAMVVSLHEASRTDQALTSEQNAGNFGTSSSRSTGLQGEQKSSTVLSTGSSGNSSRPARYTSDKRFCRAYGTRRQHSGIAAYRSVRVLLLGGGELPARLKGPLQALFPSAHISTAYGMTEACSSMTFGPLDMQSSPPAFACSSPASASSSAADSAMASGTAREGATEQPASSTLSRPSAGASRGERKLGASAIPVGWPPPGIEMAIAPLLEDGSSSGRDISCSDTPAGEILTRGPHIMLGYWGHPEATAAAQLPGGWLRTGDLGQVDCRGCLWLLGRIKDTVRSGSENINAAAVERVLLQVPGVAAAAVVGLPHSRLGEQVSALLSLSKDVIWSENADADASVQTLNIERTPRLSAASVKEACRQRGLSSFMLPRVLLAQHSPLPTNASGKVLKQIVREIMLTRLRSHGPTSRM